MFALSFKNNNDGNNNDGERNLGCANYSISYI
jgi:hypothetical protein